MKHVKYYFTNSWLFYLYLFFGMLTAYAIEGISSILAIRIILYALDIVMLIVIIAAISFRTGENAYKAKRSNLAKLRITAETGDEYPLEYEKEYKWYKGIILGLCPSIVLVFAYILQLIFILSGSDSLAAAYITEIFYGIFYYPSRDILGNASVFYTFYGIIVMVVPALVCYMLGAKKEKAKIEDTEKTSEKIHGKKR